MTSKQVLLTDEGLKKLEAELEELKTVMRKDIAEKIKVALSFGDLSENSEYDEAKNDQALVEARIAQIEAMLKNAKILDENEVSTEIVNVGSKVKVLDMEYKEEVTYRIVGSTEANPMNGRISDESPLGKVLIGKRVGDEVSVDAPAGTIFYKILEISK